MTKSALGLILLFTATIGLGACTTYDHSPTSKPPGTYKTSTETTNSNGTDIKTDQTTHVYRDANGNKKATVTTETTRDPEGLFNSTTTKTTKTYN